MSVQWLLPHIECMPPAERPKVEVDSDEEDAAAAKPAAPPAAAAAAAADDDDDAAGVVAPPTAVAREASAGAPSKPKPAFGKPPEKLKYELTGYSWFAHAASPIGRRLDRARRHPSRRQRHKRVGVA